MIVVIHSNCRMLSTRGEQALFTGELTLEAIKNVLNAEVAEIVKTRDGDTMIIDEEGKCKGLPRNDYATHLYKYAYDKNGKELDFIAGDVVIIPSPVMELWELEDNEDYED